MSTVPSSTPSPKNEELKLSIVPETDPFLVQFGPNDPDNPQNWSRLKRWYLTTAGGLLVLNVTFASSAPSGILPNLIEQFKISELVGILTVSLFVAGYCVGPLLWGPLSEQYGRRPIFIYTFAPYTCFQVGAALSKNTASILVFRFLGGVFAAAPLTNSGALVADIWDANTRGKALAIFTVAPFAGPALGPTAAGFIGDSISWRWLFWIMAIFTVLCLFLVLFTMPETYPPVLLVKKAQKMRLETGNNAYYAPLEASETKFAQQVERVLARPFKILFQEPILMALTLYMSFAYGCLYLLFEAYPIVFTLGHGFNLGISGLMFLPIPLGGMMGVIGYIFIINPRYVREAAKYSPRPVPPEFRLETAMIAGPLFAVTFFWFGWTSFSTISFWAPMLSGLLMGFCISWIFLGLFNYIIDVYLFAAASALASSTVIRSLFGAGFPLFANAMYTSLNPRWASSLVGFIAIAMIPIPFVLVKFGPAIRRRSKYAPNKDLGV